nr:MAG TPA: hypothetical protein [Caudoviricetes sp.]DAY41327.1 MAG TPA: hypothetical protein [Caudoviricetes sp.]
MPNRPLIACGPFLAWGRAGKGPLSTYTQKKKEF